MNSTCQADLFQRWDKQYVRCFWDGALMQLSDPLPVACPNCRRPLEAQAVEPNGYDPDTDDVVALEIDVPALKGLLREARLAINDYVGDRYIGHRESSLARVVGRIDAALGMAERGNVVTDVAK
jgi:hypothetical protein